MEKKVSCGAIFFQTQAIFDVPVFEKFITAIKHLRKDIKILGGIVPLRSSGMARYMNANIPGVFIPDTVIERMDKATDVEEESAEIASDILGFIRDMCDGVHFMPIRGNHLVAKILDKL